MALDKAGEVRQLLGEAEAAHHRYEQQELKGEYDDDWARWYAGFAVERGISVILNHAVSVKDLTEFLMRTNEDYKTADQSVPWAEYTARRIVEEL